MIRKYEIFKDITLFRFGDPFKTGAVVIDVDQINFKEVKDIYLFDKNVELDKVVFNKTLSDGDSIYGLGETLGSLNKRGKIYRCYSSDDFLHTPEKEALYGSHPFFIIDGDETVGVFIDCPSEIKIDAGFKDINALSIEVSSTDIDLYIFKAKNKLDIISSFLGLVGTPYIPPKWAFGYQQCRWSYPDRNTVESIGNKFRSLDIPCDVIYLDIDYMKDFKVFTVDEDKFPDFKDFIAKMREKGFKIAPIVDPGVKIEKDYEVYEEGKRNGYFCKKENGSDFVGTVWPGATGYPDFANSKVREWWGGLYSEIVKSGVCAFWNDMNEPSIFFTPDGLKNFYALTDQIKKKKDPGFDFFSIKDSVNGLSNKREDYQSFFHNLDDGKVICHDKIHNLYGYLMALATSDGLKKLLGNKRYLLLSRSSYIGAHRFTSIWMGDNQSWWEHIIVNIRMLQSLNMCGFFYTGADIGGFGCNSSAELVIRWSQLGIFSPLFRNHSALGTRNQEPWAFNAATTDIIRDIIKFRYALIPYMYSEFLKSIINSKCLILPVSFVFEEPVLKNIEDQFMLGESIMAAPIYTPNSKGRYVTLPDVKWLCWKVKNFADRDVSIYNPGSYFINCELDKTLTFIKENSIIVLTRPQNYVGEKKITELLAIAFVTDKASYMYYDDDGETYDYQNGKFINLNIFIEKSDGDYEVYFDDEEPAEYKNDIQTIKFEIYDENGRVFTKVISR